MQHGQGNHFGFDEISLIMSQVAFQLRYYVDFWKFSLTFQTVLSCFHYDILFYYFKQIFETIRSPQINFSVTCGFRSWKFLKRDFRFSCSCWCCLSGAHGARRCNCGQICGVFHMKSWPQLQITSAWLIRSVKVALDLSTMQS